MANKYIGETSAKYWKQKNDETYVNEDELVKITDLEESNSVEDDDLLIKGNPSTGIMLRIKIANFLDGIKEKLLGNTDISSFGDGTVTGAISENAKGVSENADDIAKNKEDTDTAIDELNSALAEIPSNFSVQTQTVTVSITAGGSASGTIDVSREGYRALGVVGYNHSSSVMCTTRAIVTISSQILEYNIRHVGSSDITDQTARFVVLYYKR